MPYEPIVGTYPVRLDANESFLTPPPELLSKIKDSVASISFNRYPDPYAQELCRAFADYYGIDAENVMAGNGSDELISVVVRSFPDEGGRCDDTFSGFLHVSLLRRNLGSKMCGVSKA